MKGSVNLTPRLEAAASYVRQGGYLADIGTDHAYLPIKLLLEGKISRSLACDVVDGPLEKAREHISLYPDISDRISLLKTDGLKGVEAFDITDIAVCGMGGELISAILGNAPFVRSGGINLVLQPMTRAHELRVFLAEAGFCTVSESIVSEGTRVYEIINAVYDGKIRSLTPLEALLGEYNLKAGSEGLYLLAKKQISSLKNKINGLKRSGRYNGEYDGLLEQLCAVCGEAK